MKVKKFLTTWSFVVFITFITSSCGGGGDPTSTPVSDNSNQNTSSVSQSVEGAWIGKATDILNTTRTTLTFVDKSGQFAVFQSNENNTSISKLFRVNYGNGIVATGKTFSTSTVRAIGDTVFSTYPISTFSGSVTSKTSFSGATKVGNLQNNMAQFDSIVGTEYLSEYDVMKNQSNIAGSYVGYYLDTWGGQFGDAITINIDSSGKMTGSYGLVNCSITGQITANSGELKNVHATSISAAACDNSIVGTAGFASLMILPSESKPSLIFLTYKASNQTSTINSAFAFIAKKI